MGGPVYAFTTMSSIRRLSSAATGSLALANSGKDTDGSQFFVTVEPFATGNNVWLFDFRQPYLRL